MRIIVFVRVNKKRKIVSSKLLYTLAASSLLVLTACSSASDSLPPTPGVATGQESFSGEMIESEELVTGDVAGGLVMSDPLPTEPTSGFVETTDDREIVKTADIRLNSLNVEDTIGEISEIIRQEDGLILDSFIQSYGVNGMEARLSAKVLPNKLDDVLLEIENTGVVESQNVSTRDVSLESRNLDAQIEAARSSVQRLEELLVQSGDLDSLLRIEMELSNRQANLDMLVNQKTFLENQIQMSSITVYVVSSVPGSPSPSISPGFSAGLERGLEDFKANLSLWLTNLGKATPYLVFIVFPLLVVSLIVAAVVRSSDRKRSEKLKKESNESNETSPAEPGRDETSGK